MSKLTCFDATNNPQDFSTILNIIVASLAVLTKSVPLSNSGNVDIQSERDTFRRQRNGEVFSKQEEIDSGSSTQEASGHRTANAKNPKINDDNGDDWYHGEMNGKGLLKVLKAFAELHDKFEGRLKKTAV